MLTDHDIRTLNAARSILERVEKDAGSRSCYVQTGEPVDGYDLGLLSEAAKHAEHAIFNVLNKARNWCHVDISDDQMYNREEVESMIRDTIDGVLIDSDEDGFSLILSGEMAEYRFNVQRVAAELWRAVQTEIGSWLAEGQAAAAMPASAVLADLHEDGYEPDDPKSRGYHERMSAISDDREKV